MKAKKRVFSFMQHKHQIAPFDSYTYANLKEDHAITARTPQQYQEKLTSNLIFILLAWWMLHFYLVWRKKKADQFILPLLMFLSGFCLLTMYSIHNPLSDKMIGNDMVLGILVGIVLIGGFSEINFVTFFNSNYKFLGWWDGRWKIHFDTVRSFIIWSAEKLDPKYKNWASKLPEGSGYLILALALTAFLFPFGTGPEGSGVKVNLSFFQPSEISKYLIIIFLAAFFDRYTDTIHKFSNNKKISSTGEIKWADFSIQFRTIAIVISGLAVLLFMYLFLGDMGPALVIAGTFIIIYSFIRKDLLELLIGLVSYYMFLKIASWLSGSQLVLFAATVAWLFVWLIYGFTINKKKQIFESAIFMNLVIAAFIFGGTMPLIGQRLQDRNDICQSIWNNEVRGGDQVAQGLWGLASGGVFGQGLGEGNPNLVPAFHTDMIFTSIGEQSGFVGLLLITLCMAFLLYRSLLTGKWSGHTFTLYLATGIAIITGIQFLIITFGNIGIIPLTGVAVPFLSYGRVSMIINMAAFGIVLSISNNRTSEEEDIKEYDLMIDASKWAYGFFVFLLFGMLFYYQFWARNETLIRPALMSNTQGARIVEYNPRIRLQLKEMDAGNIYDRNGILLATNNKDSISNHLSTYIEAGVAESIYQNELKKRKQRYYPFGENMFFWLGDFNHTTVAWNDSENDPYGYIAERRHLAALRGFNNLKYDSKGKVKVMELSSQKDKATFLYAIEKQYKYTDYDYSFLLPYLKAGKNSRKIERFNEKREKKRDIMLTVDAALQTKMQNEIANYISNSDRYGLEKDYFKGENWNKLRISVVVLNAKDGDVLAAANYPLPDMQLLKLKQEEQARTKKYGYDEKDTAEKAYTDRDLGLTYQTPPGSAAKVMSALAGLQKLGTKAADEKYYIYYDEIIEKKAKGSSADEPNEREYPMVTMEDAIVHSSNIYFVNLVNKNDLYKELGSIYQTVGIRIDSETPYYFYYKQQKNSKFETEIETNRRSALSLYSRYIEKRDTGKTPNPSIMSAGEWQWAWGQGTMSATPLNMARVAAIVANEGQFVETQFIKKGNEILKVEKANTVKIISENEANILKGYMQKESAKHKVFPEGMGGKTGTPERELFYKIATDVIDAKTGEPVMTTIYYDIDKDKDGKMNDGWYIFFINSPKEKAPLAVAVRMERLGKGISGNAVNLTNKVVLKVLGEAGYLSE
jgi:cell division protein FtsW (lipid II flippase)/cell division protein FtsI/penicillin-binding protein 2